MDKINIRYSMRKLIIILLTALASFAWAQELPTPPAGSMGASAVKSGSEYLLGMTGGWSFVARKAYVDSLQSIGYTKVQVDSAIIANTTVITPNIFAFQGFNDTEKIQKALDLAILENKVLYIGDNNERSNALWLLDSAVLLNSGAEIEINGAKLKLSDQSRDNVFRSANIGYGITDPGSNVLSNITIRGTGNAIIEGADNPRSTGDGGKALKTTAPFSLTESYGTDAGVIGETQTGDWRNIGVYLGFVKDFRIEGIKMVNMHAWAVSIERCSNGIISNLTIEGRITQDVLGNAVSMKNRDGVDIRLGSFDIVIENIFSDLGDDAVALTGSSSGSGPAGRYGNMQVTIDAATTPRPNDQDDIRNIRVSNVQGYSRTRLLRILSIGSGTKVTSINVSGITDRLVQNEHRPENIIKIGDSGYSDGLVTGVTITDVVTESWRPIELEGQVEELVVSNVISKSGFPSTTDLIYIPGGGEGINNVTSSAVVDYRGNRLTTATILNGTLSASSIPDNARFLAFNVQEPSTADGTNTISVIQNGNEIYNSAAVRDLERLAPSGNNLAVNIGLTTTSKWSEMIVIDPNEDIIFSGFPTGLTSKHFYVVPNETGVNDMVSQSYLSSSSQAISAGEYRVSALNTAPSSATAPGTAGEIRVTATHIYVCTATNTWVRAALTTW